LEPVNAHVQRQVLGRGSTRQPAATLAADEDPGLACVSSPIASPIRTLAVAAGGDGRLAPGLPPTSGSAKRQRLVACPAGPWPRCSRDGRIEWRDAGLESRLSWLTVSN
jgi:hypothetical protein